MAYNNILFLYVPGHNNRLLKVIANVHMMTMQKYFCNLYSTILTYMADSYYTQLVSGHSLFAYHSGVGIF